MEYLSRRTRANGISPWRTIRNLDRRVRRHNGYCDRITGKDLYVTFAGVVLRRLHPVSFNNEGDLADVTAGADTAHYYVPLERTDGEVTVESFYAGTVAWQGVAVNTAGTLEIAPKGTASGNPKFTCARAIVKSREMSVPFDDGVTMSVTFQQSAAMAESAY